MVVLTFVVLKTQKLSGLGGGGGGGGVLRIARARWLNQLNGGESQNNKSPRDTDKTEKFPRRKIESA